MPRRSILSAAERESLLALPDTKDELIRHYTFSETDLSIIRQRRGPAIAMVETEHFTGKINASFVRFRFSLWPAAFPAHEFLISLIPVNRAITQDLTRAFT